MSKVEITDEMVDRAIAKWETISGTPVFHEVRAILEAALNPTPPEPEVVVTEEMVDAAFGIAAKGHNWPGSEMMKKFYRAMHAARPKDNLQWPSGDIPNGVGLHQRKTDKPQWFATTHSRKDDPHG